MKTIRIIFNIVAIICLPAYFACNNTAINNPDPDSNDTIETPVDNTIRGQVLSLPENYSLLKEILKQSGLAETLADTTQTYTFFVQDNADFAAAEIYNIGDLLAKLHAAIPAVKGDSALLANFIAYRTVSGTIETDSLMKMPLLETLVTDEKIFLSLDNNRSPSILKLNDLNGHLIDPDAVLDSESEYFNLRCSNGIIHKISGNLWVKNRKPYRIYWDIAEQPELMALPSFRQQGTIITLNNGDLADVTWKGAAITYEAGSIPETETELTPNFQYIYGDYLRLDLNQGNNCVQWIEFRTPVLIQGEYKVWLCYRREMEQDVKTTFKQAGKEDQALPYIINGSLYFSPPELPDSDWKYYTAKQTGTGVYMYGCSPGVIKVESTGRHSLLFEPINNLRCCTLGNWDMIQFIPVDEDQLLPRVDMQGNWIGSEEK